MEPERIPKNEELRKTVSIPQLVAIAFLLVSGGPFGQEEAIQAGGAKLTFIATICIPLLYSFPLSLLSSEQATRMPACGGAIEWGTILGKYPSWFNSYTRFVRSVVDNALYPSMVCNYLKELIPQLDKIQWRILTVLLSNIFSLVCNYTGLDTVGWVSIVLFILIISPFVLFFIFATNKMTPSAVFADYPPESGKPNIAQLISTIIWQCSGFDTVAALSKEVRNPRVTFPISMLITVFLVILVYLLPTIAGICTEPDPQKWGDTTFASISLKLPHCSSGWLEKWISFAGVCSSLSLLNVALSCTGRELYASGRIGAFPFSSYLGRLTNNCKKEPTPMIGIIVMSVLTIPLSLIDFSSLLQLTGITTVLAQLIQVVVLIFARYPKINCAKKNLQILESQNQPSMTDELLSQQPNYSSSQYLTSEFSESKNHDKFIIPGGIFSLLGVCIPLVGVSVFLLAISNWTDIVYSFSAIVAFFVLRGISLFFEWSIKKCKDSKQNKIGMKQIE
ncbi:Amino acid permease [Histomonas meleagridis]|uniref:Amino acid permease n=1 Tax=Histomonas meleagridis TaxID=135588 RepID=UPI00355972D9|nr:Amino acid permease [Histomonas meleagridis]KAH0796833.1 Amino acid permease [Histomonas meleagridis]